MSTFIIKCIKVCKMLIAILVFELADIFLSIFKLIIDMGYILLSNSSRYVIEFDVETWRALKWRIYS